MNNLHTLSPEVYERAAELIASGAATWFVYETTPGKVWDYIESFTLVFGEGPHESPDHRILSLLLMAELVRDARKENSPC